MEVNKNQINNVDTEDINSNDEGSFNEELENDILLLELHKRLTQMKKDRKKAEQDTDLLNNRLNLLKNEENKVNKLSLNFTFERLLKKLKLQERKRMKSIWSKKDFRKKRELKKNI